MKGFLKLFIAALLLGLVDMVLSSPVINGEDNLSTLNLSSKSYYILSSADAQNEKEAIFENKQCIVPVQNNIATSFQHRRNIVQYRIRVARRQLYQTLRSANSQLIIGGCSLSVNQFIATINYTLKESSRFYSNNHILLFKRVLII